MFLFTIIFEVLSGVAKQWETVRQKFGGSSYKDPILFDTPLCSGLLPLWPLGEV